jgi:MFS transporter, DHA1 family, multidrug resistance protein
LKQPLKAESLPIYLTVYASFFDTHAQLPILALFAGSLGADPFWIGTVVGVYSLFNIIGNGIGGSAIDRWGWRKPMLAGLVGVNVVLYGYQLVGSTMALVLVRGLHGLAGGILIPATLASLSPETGKHFTVQHNKNVAFYGVSVGLAALTGPLFAGLISNYHSYKSAYLGIAVLMTIATVFTFFYTKESETPLAVRGISWARVASIKLPPLPAAACVMGFALMGGTGTLAAFMPVAAKAIGFSQGGIGMLFGLFALVVILLQLYRAATHWPRYNLFGTAMAGAVILAAALLIVHAAVNGIALVVAVALYGTGFSLVFPTLLVMVMRGISSDQKGIIMGIFFAFYSLGAAAIPPLGGLIWQSFPAVTPLLTAAVVLLLFTLWVNRYRRISAGETKQA